MSDAVQVTLFVLALVVPVFGGLGLLVWRAQRSGPRKRPGGTVSVSDTMNDISNAID